MTFFLRLLWRFRMPSGTSTPHVKSGIIPQLNMGRGVKQGAASPHLSKRGGCGPQAAGGASAVSRTNTPELRVLGSSSANNPAAEAL